MAVAVVRSAGCLELAAGAETVTNVCKPRVIADVKFGHGRPSQGGRGKRDAAFPDQSAKRFRLTGHLLGVVKHRDGKSLLFFGSNDGYHAICAAVTDRFGSFTQG